MYNKFYSKALHYHKDDDLFFDNKIENKDKGWDSTLSKDKLIHLVHADDLEEKGKPLTAKHIREAVENWDGKYKLYSTLGLQHFWLSNPTNTQMSQKDYEDNEAGLSVFLNPTYRDPANPKYHVILNSESFSGHNERPNARLSTNIHYVKHFTDKKEAEDYVDALQDEGIPIKGGYYQGKNKE